MITEEKIDEWWLEFRKIDGDIGYFDYYGFGSGFRDFIKKKVQSLRKTAKTDVE